MKTKFLKTLTLVTLALSASVLASGCIIVSDDNDASLTIDNQSSVVFTEIAAARSDVNEPYQTIVVDLFPDDIVTIDFDCDFYDILMINEFGGECEIFDLDLCFSDDLWIITDNDVCTFAEGLKLSRDHVSTREVTLETAPATK